MNYKIKRLEDIRDDDKLIFLVVKAHNYLQRKDPHLNAGKAQLWIKAVAAYGRTGKVIGVITYYKHEKGLWIALSYTDTRYRRKGVYRALFKELQQICIEEEFEFIESGVGFENHVMQVCAEQTGRVATSVNYKWINGKEKK